MYNWILLLLSENAEWEYRKYFLSYAKTTLVYRHKEPDIQSQSHAQTFVPPNNWMSLTPWVSQSKYVPKYN